MTPKKPTKKELQQRVEELEKKLEEKEKEAGKYLSQLKYAKADLENIQKQSHKRMQEFMDKANGGLLQQLLPLMDEMEILATRDADKEKLVQGMEMVLKKLQDLRLQLMLRAHEQRSQAKLAGKLGEAAAERSVGEEAAARGDRDHEAGIP